ncbi:MAG TPA: protease inhibitor I42 family protein [Gaiellaceae bacterium]|nr:protease inhibitor I42 family protein [Gaiellaceae bacterium]
MLVAPFLAAAALAGAPVQLDAADNGRGVRIRPATPVVVTLSSNRSTGFRWRLLQPLDRRVLTLLSHRYVASTSGLVGVPGTEIWRFRTVRAGTFTLRLGYVRPFAPTQVERLFWVDFRVS